MNSAGLPMVDLPADQARLFEAYSAAPTPFPGTARYVVARAEGTEFLVEFYPTHVGSGRSEIAVRPVLAWMTPMNQFPADAEITKLLEWVGSNSPALVLHDAMSSEGRRYELRDGRGYRGAPPRLWGGL